VRLIAARLAGGIGRENVTTGKPDCCNESMRITETESKGHQQRQDHSFQNGLAPSCRACS
jgi:hypothetical protein